MALEAQVKTEVIQSNRLHDKDSGSSAIQVALITARLADLKGHFEKHKKDHSSRRGLIKMVGQRKRHLDYIKKHSVQDYRDLIAKLGIRK
jgi:small subunit ribosomal protein S15